MILLGDNDASLRALLRLVFNDAGYDIDEAANSEQALATIGGGKSNFLIADHCMPERTASNF
jgi:CheY-like chemotaxis protein